MYSWYWQNWGWTNHAKSGWWHGGRKPLHKEHPATSLVCLWQSLEQCLWQCGTVAPFLSREQPSFCQGQRVAISALCCAAASAAGAASGWVGSHRFAYLTISCIYIYIILLYIICCVYLYIHTHHRGANIMADLLLVRCEVLRNTTCIVVRSRMTRGCSNNTRWEAGMFFSEPFQWHMIWSILVYRCLS